MGSNWAYILRSSYAAKTYISHLRARINTIEFETDKHYRLDKLRLGISNKKTSFDSS